MESVKKRIATLKAQYEKKEAEITRLTAALEAETQQRQMEEEKNKALMEDLQNAEATLDDAEDEYEKVKATLNQTNEEKENFEREWKKLENVEAKSGEKLDNQTVELQEAKAITEEVDRKSEMALEKLKVVEQDVERLEQEAEIIEAKNKELTEDSKIMGGVKKSFEAMESNFGTKDKKQQTKIDKLIKDLEVSEKEKVRAVAQRNELTLKVDELEDEVTKVLQLRDEARENLNDTVRELGEM